VVRWNAIIDVGGTPPPLRDGARKPRALDRKIKQIADDNGCDAEVWWDRFNWFAYVTLTERRNGDAVAALQELEPIKVRKELNAREKATGITPRKTTRRKTTTRRSRRKTS
jgi:hypothetical protein